jgi:hypothetical protein
MAEERGNAIYMDKYCTCIHRPDSIMCCQFKGIRRAELCKYTWCFLIIEAVVSLPFHPPGFSLSFEYRAIPPTKKHKHNITDSHRQKLRNGHIDMDTLIYEVTNKLGLSMMTCIICFIC